ncbi:MAG: HypC/HybG/HupF family hydrogenase formation chaperone [Acidimicrobiaceae bacterium]|nr:HypC/HybG/HupF family hydrogenase formation chaperone [Acidimicrobiaceae bacterium]
MSAAFPAESLAAAAATLARRFSAGATMWCVAPRWSAHARHVAVEFVHPVIVGKRALPSIELGGADVTDSLRLLARPGDILLVIGAASDTTAGLLRRGDAWGLTTVWIGAGPHPDGAAASHLVWSDNPDPDRAASSGDLVVLYHVLWELTHVVFEHPGLLTEPAACPNAISVASQDEVCVTCSDEGRVAEILDVGEGGEADALAGGRRETIDVSLVDSVRPGDLVLVHAGTAIATLEQSS